MARKKKFAVRQGNGSMCFFCGKDCGKGGGLKRHVENIHDVPYLKYCELIFSQGARVKVSKWITDSLKSGKVRVEHVLVRHFTREPEKRYEV